MARNLKSELLGRLEDVQPPDNARKRRPTPKSFSKVSAAIDDDPHVLKLFNATGGDYRDPFAWYGLMGIVADFLFDIPKRNLGGRPKKMDPTCEGCRSARYHKCSSRNDGNTNT
ncbi:MAG: hypothetical protein ACXVOI_11030 [Tumebacillaceae bacterium]